MELQLVACPNAVLVLFLFLKLWVSSCWQALLSMPLYLAICDVHVRLLIDGRLCWLRIVAGIIMPNAHGPSFAIYPSEMFLHIPSAPLGDVTHLFDCLHPVGLSNIKIKYLFVGKESIYRRSFLINI